MNDKHIMLVEDDITLQNLIKKLLSNNQYIVSTAKNIQEAERFINIFVFDLAGGHPTFLEINQNILKYIWP